MEKELVFGHKSPDTDAVSAAIAYSYLQNKLGYDTEAVALGEINEETEYAFNKFNQDKLRVISTAKNEVSKVMLVDHNEAQQSIDDFEDVEITHVVDHHKIDLTTGSPLYYRAEPIGCTSTIIYKMYRENDIEIPVNIAGLMMSAIISDTLLLKSPTTTDEDKKALEALSKIAGVDYNEYGLEMLKAGTNLDDKTAKELINQDAKTFEMNGNSVRIAQVNTVDLDDTMKREAEFKSAINDEVTENKYDLFILMITNILNSDTKAIVEGTPQAIAVFNKSFNVEVKDGKADLPGVVSRKKQVVPPLMNNF